MILSISELHKNLPVVSSVVPFVGALVVGVYLTQIAAATGFSFGGFTKVVRFSLGSFLFVTVSVEAFLVFAVFCVIETLLDEEGLVAIFPVSFEAFLVFAVFCAIETLLDEEGLVVIFPVIEVVFEEAVTVVFPSIIVFAEDVLEILLGRWQIVNPPFVSVVFSPV